jgi:MFS family permease
MSDRTGKRMPFIFLGYLLSVIFKFLLSIANTWQAILAFVSFERLGKTRDAPRDAIIAMSTENRGRGFGLHQAMDAAGGVVGTIIVFILFWKFSLDFSKIILIACLITAVSLIPLIFVKEPKFKAQKVGLFKDVKNFSKELKYFIFTSCIFTLANFGVYMFLLLRAKQVTGSILYAFALFLLFYALWSGFSIPFGKLSDKLGRKRVLMTGYLLAVITSIGFIFAKTLLPLVLLFLLYGMVYALTHANQRAFVADLSDDMKGTALGFYHFAIGLINIPAGLIAGYLWNIGYQTMFIYITTISILAVIFLYYVKDGHRNR